MSQAKLLPRVVMDALKTAVADAVADERQRCVRLVEAAMRRTTSRRCQDILWRLRDDVRGAAPAASSDSESSR